MNFKFTYNEIKKEFDNIICVPYMDLYDEICMLTRLGHNEGECGWNYDIYYINEFTCIVTGYRPKYNILIDKVTKDFIHAGFNLIIQDLGKRDYSDLCDSMRKVFETGIYEMLNKKKRGEINE